MNDSVYSSHKSMYPTNRNKVESKSLNKMKQLGNIRNIYLRKDGPMYVKFERLGEF